MALEMKFGGNKNQNLALGGLFLVLAVVLYMNYFSGPDTNAPVQTTAARPAAIPAAPLPSVARKPEEKKRIVVDRRAQEFRPRVGPARPEDRPDPMTVDPTLRVELLARLENVKFGGGMRSLFNFADGQSGPAGAPVAKIIVAPKPVRPTIFIGPMNKPPDPPKVVVAPPQAPPIPLKFYGFSSGTRGTNKRGFFLDGDDILVGSEGELLKQRYKVIRIGLANVTMEDTQFKQQQTLPIVPEAGGGF